MPESTSINGAIEWASNATGARFLYLNKNGSIFLWAICAMRSMGRLRSRHVTCSMPPAVNDYV